MIYTATFLMLAAIACKLAQRRFIGGEYRNTKLVAIARLEAVFFILSLASLIFYNLFLINALPPELHPDKTPF